MTAPAIPNGLDGLFNLSQREGVDIRPTLLRVLTDLYVQTRNHTRDEERQYVELASRLIDEVDDATRAAIRARLSIYPETPTPLVWKLRLSTPADPHTGQPGRTQSYAASQQQQDIFEIDVEPDLEDLEIVSEPEVQTAPTLSMQPEDASKLIDVFLAAGRSERTRMLYSLTDAPLKPSPRIDPRRARRAIALLEQAAMAADAPKFTAELADSLIVTARVALQIVEDAGGEPLACAAKALGMPSDVFQRVLLFLNPKLGASVTDVYRLARLYDTISERAALIMLTAWRGATVAATRAKYRPALYDDERQRARSTPSETRSTLQPGGATEVRNLSVGPSRR
ncbi:hypothetical protein V1291_000950 [Nitrobacteraceae bacterium AZCC 1564]